MLAGLPDWKSLLTKMAEAVRSKDPLTAAQITDLVTSGDLTTAADYFWLSRKVLDGNKVQIIKDILQNYDAKPLQPLASLPFQTVVTTNFDRSIFDAIAGARNKSPIDFRFNDAIFSQALWEKELNVVRIHGGIESPRQMVLSDSQFEKLLQEDSYVDFLSHIFLRRQVLFLGFSFYDPAIRHVFQLIDKKFGPDSEGRHMAILPNDNASEMIQKATRLNIEVIKYSPDDKHKELWEGIARYKTSEIYSRLKPDEQITGPYSATKKYLASCYARASVASEHVPLREIIIEGILSASIQNQYPKSLGTTELKNEIRRAVGLKGSEVDEVFNRAIKELLNSGLIRRHKEGSEKGIRYAWIDKPDNSASLEHAIKTLTQSIVERAYVQEGWRTPDNVNDSIKFFLEEIVQRRGWDLGAAFAAGKAPDPVQFESIFSYCGIHLSTFDVARISRIFLSLLQNPTEIEADLLGELGRVSFAIELAFQAPRSTLLHSQVLPKRIYLDANILMPSLVEGHPHHETFKHTLSLLEKASIASGEKTQIIVLQGYLNEVISHRNAAKTYALEAGNDLKTIARHDVLFVGSGNVNVFIGAYINNVENGGTSDFNEFLKKYAPYETEAALERWLSPRGYKVARKIKNPTYSEINFHLEKTNAKRLENGKKEPILIEHDALQLALLNDDYQSGTKSLFITADRRLYEDIASSKEFAVLADCMMSHIGIVQLVDLLIGLKKEERIIGQLLWSGNVSENSQRIRSYLTVEALKHYKVAMSMNMSDIVDAHTVLIEQKFERDNLSFDSHDPKKRVRAFKTLGTLESNFFSDISNATQKLR